MLISGNYPRGRTAPARPLIRHQLLIETLNSQEIEIKALRFSIIRAHSVCLYLSLIGPTTVNFDDVLSPSFNGE